MPRLVQVPSYRRHKQSGQAIVTFRLASGRKKDYLLGPYGSPESKAEYARLLAEFEAAGGAAPGSTAGEAPTVNELLVDYLTHCECLYRTRAGELTGHAAGIAFALRPLMNLYGHTLARDFGPLGLKAVRAKLVEAGNSRTTVNQRARMVRQFFRWCVAEQKVPPAVLEGLRAVAPLQPGRSEAPDRPPVRPADESQVEAALQHMPPPVAALVQLQLLTGARGGELLRLQAADVDRSGPVWTYRPAQHKNAHKGKDREIYFGPKAQSVLLPWLEKRPTGFLFSPATAEAERYQLLAEFRKTPRFPGHHRRAEARRRKRRRRDDGEFYTACSYRRAIERACARVSPMPAHLKRRQVKKPGQESRKENFREWSERLGPKGLAEVLAWKRANVWTPHRLRHTAGTRIRREHGIEMARVILGHSSSFTTEIYAEVDRQRARDVAAELG